MNAGWPVLQTDEMAEYYRLYIDCMLTCCSPPEGIEGASTYYRHHLETTGVAIPLLDQYDVLIGCLEDRNPPDRFEEVADAVADYIKTTLDVEPGREDESPPLAALLAWIARQWQSWEKEM